jgi:uncharacterized phage-associated protein
MNFATYQHEVHIRGGYMAVKVQRFDARKAIEALVYIAGKTPQAGLHKIAKIFYFSDKLHLERFGSMVSNDVYIAMDNGPVPSRIYDYMKFAAGRSVPVSNAILAARDAVKVIGHNVFAIRQPDCDFLSNSEIQCIDETIAKYGRKTFGQLTDESHDSAWESVEQDAPIPMVEIIKTLPSSEQLLSYMKS